MKSIARANGLPIDTPDAKGEAVLRLLDALAPLDLEGLKAVVEMAQRIGMSCAAAKPETPIGASIALRIGGILDELCDVADTAEGLAVALGRAVPPGGGAELRALYKLAETIADDLSSLRDRLDLLALDAAKPNGSNT